MTSNDILQLINKMEGKKRSAISESIRHTVESTEELSKNTLWVAFSALRTAEAVDTLIEVLRVALKSTVAQSDPSEITVKRVVGRKLVATKVKVPKVGKEIPTISIS